MSKNNQLRADLQQKFEGRILQLEELYDCLVVEISPVDLLATADALKNDASLSFNFLTLLGAVHYPESKERELCLVYHLHSWKNQNRLRIKCYLSIDKPQIQSLTSVFETANWMERETFDFYGVEFQGHPNLKRILNMDSMDYHPMLKQFHLEDETREDKDDRFFGR
jgi:NADH-quinone oxidoreductase subunit C